MTRFSYRGVSTALVLVLCFLALATNVKPQVSICPFPVRTPENSGRICADYGDVSLRGTTQGVRYALQAACLPGFSDGSTCVGPTTSIPGEILHTKSADITSIPEDAGFDDLVAYNVSEADPERELVDVFQVQASGSMVTTMLSIFESNALNYVAAKYVDRITLRFSPLIGASGPGSNFMFTAFLAAQEAEIGDSTYTLFPAEESGAFADATTKRAVSNRIFNARGQPGFTIHDHPAICSSVSGCGEYECEFRRPVQEEGVSEEEYGLRLQSFIDALVMAGYHEEGRRDFTVHKPKGFVLVATESSGDYFIDLESFSVSWTYAEDFQLSTAQAELYNAIVSSHSTVQDVSEDQHVRINIAGKQNDLVAVDGEEHTFKFSNTMSILGSNPVGYIDTPSSDIGNVNFEFTSPEDTGSLEVVVTLKNTNIQQTDNTDGPIDLLGAAQAGVAFQFCTITGEAVTFNVPRVSIDIVSPKLTSMQYLSPDDTTFDIEETRHIHGTNRVQMTFSEAVAIPTSGPKLRSPVAYPSILASEDTSVSTTHVQRVHVNPGTHADMDIDVTGPQLLAVEPTSNFVDGYGNPYELSPANVATLALDFAPPQIESVVAVDNDEEDAYIADPRGHSVYPYRMFNAHRKLANFEITFTEAVNGDDASVALYCNGMVCDEDDVSFEAGPTFAGDQLNFTLSAGDDLEGTYLEIRVSGVADFAVDEDDENVHTGIDFAGSWVSTDADVLRRMAVVVDTEKPRFVTVYSSTGDGPLRATNTLTAEFSEPVHFRAEHLTSGHALTSYSETPGPLHVQMVTGCAEPYFGLGVAPLAGDSCPSSIRAPGFALSPSGTAHEASATFGFDVYFRKQLTTGTFRFTTSTNIFDFSGNELASIGAWDHPVDLSPAEIETIYPQPTYTDCSDTRRIGGEAAVTTGIPFALSFSSAVKVDTIDHSLFGTYSSSQPFLRTPTENHYAEPSTDATGYFTWLFKVDEGVKSAGSSDHILEKNGSPVDENDHDLKIPSLNSFCFDTVSPVASTSMPSRPDEIDDSAHNYATFTVTVDKKLNPYSLCNEKYNVDDEILCGDFLSQFELVARGLDDEAQVLDVNALISDRTVTYLGADSNGENAQFRFRYEFKEGAPQRFATSLKVLAHDTVEATPDNGIAEAQCTLAESQKGVDSTKSFIYNKDDTDASTYNLKDCVGIEDDVRTIAYDPSGIGFIAPADNPSFPKNEGSIHPPSFYSGHGNKLRVSVTTAETNVDRVFTSVVSQKVRFASGDVVNYEEHIVIGGYSRPATYIVEFDDFVKPDLSIVADSGLINEGDYEWVPVGDTVVYPAGGETFAKSWEIVLSVNYDQNIMGSISITHVHNKWLDRLGNGLSDHEDVFASFVVDNESPVILEPSSMDVVLVKSTREGCAAFEHRFLQFQDSSVTVYMAFNSEMFDTTSDSNVKSLLQMSIVNTEQQPIATDGMVTYNGPLDLSDASNADIVADFDTSAKTIVGWTVDFSSVVEGDVTFTIQAPWTRDGARTHDDEDPRDEHGNILLFNDAEAKSVTYHLDRNPPDTATVTITPEQGAEHFYSVLVAQGHNDFKVELTFTEAVYVSSTENSGPDTSIVTSFHGDGFGCLSTDGDCTEDVITVNVASGSCASPGDQCSGVICITFTGFKQEVEGTIQFTVSGLYDVGGNAVDAISLEYQLDAQAPVAHSSIASGLVHAFAGQGNLVTYGVESEAHGFVVSFSEPIVESSQLTYTDFISTGSVVPIGYTDNELESVLRGATFTKREDGTWLIQPMYRTSESARYGFFPPMGGSGDISITMRGYAHSTFVGSPLKIQDRAGNYLTNEQAFANWNVDAIAPYIKEWSAPASDGNVNRMYPWTGDNQLPILAKTGGQISLVFAEIAPDGVDDVIVLEGYTEENNACEHWFHVVDHFGRVVECTLEVDERTVTFYPTFENIPVGSPVTGDLEFTITPITLENGDEGNVIFDVSGNPLCVPLTVGSSERCPDALPSVTAYYDVRAPQLGGATSIASGAYVWQSGNIISNTFRTIGGNPADRVHLVCSDKTETQHMYCPGTVVFVFSERMDPSSINYQSFTVTGGENVEIDSTPIYWQETLPEKTEGEVTFDADTRARIRLRGYEHGQTLQICVNTEGDHVPYDYMGNRFATPGACVTVTVDTEKPQVVRQYGTSPVPAETIPTAIGYIGSPDKQVTITTSFSKPVAINSIIERGAPRVDERRGIHLEYVGTWPASCDPDAFFFEQGNPTSLPGLAPHESTIVYHIHLCPTDGELNVAITDEIYDRVGNKVDVSDNDHVTWSYNVVPMAPPAIDFTATVSPARGECLKSFSDTQSMNVILTEQVYAMYDTDDVFDHVEYAVSPSLDQLPSEDSYQDASTPLVVDDVDGNELTFKIGEIIGPVGELTPASNIYMTWSVSNPDYHQGRPSYAIFIRLKANSFKSVETGMENSMLMISYILDPVVPTISDSTPLESATVPLKHEIVVRFSEPVTIGSSGDVELVADDVSQVTAANVPTITNGGIVVVYSSSDEEAEVNASEGPGDIITFTVDTNNWIAPDLPVEVEDVKYTFLINRAEDCAGTAFADRPFAKELNIDVVIPVVTDLTAPSIITKSNTFSYVFNTPVTYPEDETPTLQFVDAVNQPVVTSTQFNRDGDDNIIGVEYTFTVAPDAGDATYTVRLDGFVSVKSGNPMVPHTTDAIGVDVDTHTIESLIPDVDTVIGPKPVEFTLTLSEGAVLTQGDVIVHEVIDEFTHMGSATVEVVDNACGDTDSECLTWTFRVTMSVAEEITKNIYISFQEGTILDTNGNGLRADRSFRYVIDFRIPTVTSFSFAGEGSIAPYTGAVYTMVLSKPAQSFNKNWIRFDHAMFNEIASVAPVLGSDNKEFTITVNFNEGTSNNEAVTVTIGDESFTDAIGNVFKEHTQTVQVDMLSPRMTDSVDVGSVTSEMSFTMSFTEGVTGLTEEVIKSGCRMGGSSCGDINVVITGAAGSSSYVVEISNFASGIAGSAGHIALSNGDVRDLAGNGFRSNSANYVSFVVDTVPPTMSTPSLHTFGESVRFDLTFSENVLYDSSSNPLGITVTTSGVTLDTGSISVTAVDPAADGYASTWTVVYVVTPDEETTETADSSVVVSAASFADRAGNTLTAGSTIDVAHNFVSANVLDIIFVGAHVDGGKHYVRTDNNIAVIVEIDREVDFPEDSIQITGDDVTYSVVESCDTESKCGGRVSGSGPTSKKFYTFNIRSGSALPDDEYTLTFTDQIQTPEGNPLQTRSATFVVDTVEPTVVSTEPPSSTYNRGETIQVEIQFSEPMRNLVSGDFNVDNEFTLTVTSQTRTSVSLTIAGIPENVQGGQIAVAFGSSVVDLAGNRIAGSHVTVRYDRRAPSIMTITPDMSTTAGEAKRMSTAAFANGINVRYDEATTISDVAKAMVITSDDETAFTVTGVTRPSGSDTQQFSVAVGGGEYSDLLVSVKLVGSEIVDRAGWSSPDRELFFILDNVAPTAQVTTNAVELSKRAVSAGVSDTLIITIALSEPTNIMSIPELVSVVDADDNSVLGALTVVGPTPVAGETETYTIRIGGLTEAMSPLTVKFDGIRQIQDGAGNLVDVGTLSDIELTIDTTAPQLDASSVTPASGTNIVDETFEMCVSTVDAEEGAVVTFTLIGISVVGQEEGSGTYCATLQSPPLGGNAAVAITVEDVFGNEGQSVSVPYTFESNLVVVVSVEPSAGALPADSDGNAYITVTFSRAVTGFAASDLIVSQGTVGTPAVAPDNGSGFRVEYPISGLADGNLTVTFSDDTSIVDELNTPLDIVPDVGLTLPHTVDLTVELGTYVPPVAPPTAAPEAAPTSGDTPSGSPDADAAGDEEEGLDGGIIALIVIIVIVVIAVIVVIVVVVVLRKKKKDSKDQGGVAAAGAVDVELGQSMSHSDSGSISGSESGGSYSDDMSHSGSSELDSDYTSDSGSGSGSYSDSGSGSHSHSESGSHSISDSGSHSGSDYSDDSGGSDMSSGSEDDDDDDYSDDDESDSEVQAVSEGSYSD